MILEEIASQKPVLLEGIEPRIAHPEDLVWRKGSNGFLEAIKALMYISKNPQSATIKFDGSPALIFGRDPETRKIAVTDKSGFGATKYDGFANSASQLYDLFYNRQPGNKERIEFASRMAQLWPMLASIIPENFVGFLKGDVLYSQRPPIINGYFYFSPNKIVYRVPVDSNLGRAVGASKAAIAVHGYIKDRSVTVPTPIDDVGFLEKSQELLIIPSSPTTAQNISVTTPRKSKHLDKMDAMLHPDSLRERKISDFGKLIGKYIAGLASQGIDSYDSAAEDFKNWIDNNDKVTSKKRFRISEYILEHPEGYDALWKSIIEVHKLKTEIKQQLDQESQQELEAALKGEKGHEGYVAATPYGKIKLVDRAVFMAKDD